MANICRETAERMYEICNAEQDEPEEIVAQMAAAIHEAMFRAHFCRPRCDSQECEQINGTD